MAGDNSRSLNGDAGFCRDCLNIQNKPARRCSHCGSPRLTQHHELFGLTLAHIDCDAFYASVEKRDNPELIDKPVIIGGGKRGVVSTCCYIARIHGVRSAMPMFKALKACPQAVVVKPNMQRYVEVGLQVREMMRGLTPAVEPISIDEAFLDLSGTELLHKEPPALVLARFAQKIEDEVGISVSVGLSYNKFLAKVASDFEKPRGFSVIGRAEAVEFLADKPVTLIWGVGRATQKKLHQDGIYTVGSLQKMEENDLARRYGSIGLRLSRLSRGLDYRSVKPGGGAKSISSETTFFTDKSTAEQLLPVLRNLSEKVSASLKKKHLAGRTIVLKLKSASFKSLTRNRSIPDPTQLADKIYREGRQMLEKELDGTQFRLIGIGISEISSDEMADPEDLIDEQAGRNAAVERAMDNVREKFGGRAVGYGLNFKFDEEGNVPAQAEELSAPKNPGKQD